jgi:hypothetical protein
MTLPIQPQVETILTLQRGAPCPDLRTWESKLPTGLLRPFATARKYAVPTLIVLAITLYLTAPALAQGCAQCLDSTRSTPPAVQAAYRHAILLLSGAGATIFITGTLLLRRQR